MFWLFVFCISLSSYLSVHEGFVRGYPCCWMWSGTIACQHFLGSDVAILSLKMGDLLTPIEHTSWNFQLLHWCMYVLGSVTQWLWNPSVMANSANSLELKGGALSLSSLSLGVPCVVNMVLSFSIVGFAVECVFATFGYLVLLSTATMLYCTSG